MGTDDIPPNGQSPDVLTVELIQQALATLYSDSPSTPDLYVIFPSTAKPLVENSQSEILVKLARYTEIIL